MNWTGVNGEQIHHGSDSTVTIPQDTDCVYKDYYSLGREDVSRYAQLHKILSTEMFVMELSSELQSRFGIGLKRVETRFLDIGENISSHLGYTRHEIPLVEGDVLSNIGKYADFSEGNSHSFIDYLEKEIAYFVSRKLGISPRLLGSMNLFYIFSGNIKIMRVDKNILSLLVTDIGSSVSRLLEENKKAIDKILQTLHTSQRTQ